MSFVGYLITVFALPSAVVFAGLYLKGVRSPEALGAWLGRRMVRIKGFARGHPVLFALVVLPALPFALTGVLVAAFYAVLLMLLFRTLNGADPDATDTCEPQTGFSDYFHSSGYGQVGVPDGAGGIVIEDERGREVLVDYE